MRPCSHCGEPVDIRDATHASKLWCSATCRDGWWAAHPEEAAGWVRVEDLSAEQLALVEATLGLGAKC